MKKWMLGILTIVIAAGIVIVWNTRSNTPVEAARQMIRAMEDHKQDELQRVFCDPDLATLVLTSSSSEGHFVDLHYKEVPHAVAGVTVTITGRMESPSLNTPEAITWTLQLQKSGRNWCIMGLQTTPNVP